jgi:hypothetical protein
MKRRLIKAFLFCLFYYDIIKQMKNKSLIIIVAIIAFVILTALLFIMAMKECQGVGGYKNGAYIERADCEIHGPSDVLRIIRHK